MPQQHEPVSLQHVDLESAPFVHAYDPMNAKYALSLVNTTFFQYETYRRQNHEDRWLVQESLYLGWLPPKVWENTNVPRASLGMPLTFDQVETALPVVYSSIFEQSDKWFEIEGDYGSDPKRAQQIEDYLCYAVDDLQDGTGRTARTEFYHAIKDVLLYGNGGMLIEWDGERRTPILSHLDIRDIYVDDAAPSPNVDDCRTVILRRLMSVQELIDLRGDTRMNIPPDEVLWHMAKNKPITTSDHNQEVRDTLRGQTRDIARLDTAINPSDQRIEVLVYYSKTRIIWVLNREYVAFIGDNPYNVIPLVMAPCYIVPNRFYGLSIPDVQEGNQRYIESLMNARLDEVSLALHPPRIQRRGAIMTPAQQRWRPGAVITANDAKDVVFQMPAGATQNVFSEIEFLSALAEKRTGVTGMMQGKPSAGNVNRSATGVNAQTQGSTSRMQMIVKHIEDFMIVPALHKMIKMVQVHTGPTNVLPTRATEEGDTGYINPVIFQGPIRIKIHASSRMMTKEALQQMIGPLMQFMFNGPLMQSLQQTGRTIDFEEFIRLIMEATGLRNRFALVRPLNQQEQQAAQQPDMAQQAEQQKAQQDAQVRLQMGQMKAQTEEKKIQGELQKVMLQKQPTPGEQQQQQMEMEFARQKNMFAQQLEQVKLEAQREKNRMDIEMKRMEMMLKGQSHQMSLQQMQEKAQADRAIGMHHLNMEQSRSQQNLAFEQARGIMGLEQQQQAGELKMKMMSAPVYEEENKPKRPRQRVKRPKTGSQK